LTLSLTNIISSNSNIISPNRKNGQTKKVAEKISFFKEFEKFFAKEKIFAKFILVYF